MINPIPNFDEIEVKKDFEKLPAGGYVLKIIGITNKTEEKPFLEIVFDVAEGQYKGTFANTDIEHEYLHRTRQYYTEKSMGMFKGFLKAVDESNGTKFCEEMKTKGLEEKKLLNKLVGAVLGYKEYDTTRGTIGQRAEWSLNKSADAIRQGKFNVPELKKLAKSDNTPATIPEGFSAVTDEDLPF